MLIDGIDVYGLFTGSEANGEFNVWFETGEGYHSFTLSGVNLDNIERYDEIIRTMKINAEDKTGNKYTPLREVLDFLKPKSPVALDEINVPGNMENTGDIFRCYFGKMDFDLWFPGKITGYKYGLNTTWGEEKLTADHNSVNNTVAPYEENFFACLNSPRDETGYNISCTFYLTYGDNTPMKEMVEEYVRVYSSYTDAFPMKYEKAGVVTVSDGTDLGVIIESEGKQAVILGKNQDYLFRYVITAPTSEKLMELCSIIYNFKTN